MIYVILFVVSAILHSLFIQTRKFPRPYDGTFIPMNPHHRQHRYEQLWLFGMIVLGGVLLAIQGILSGIRRRKREKDNLAKKFYEADSENRKNPKSKKKKQK